MRPIGRGELRVPLTSGPEAVSCIVKTLFGSTPPPTACHPAGHRAVVTSKLPAGAVSETMIVFVFWRYLASALGLMCDQMWLIDALKSAAAGDAMTIVPIAIPSASTTIISPQPRSSLSAFLHVLLLSWFPRGGLGSYCFLRKFQGRIYVRGLTATMSS
jgi:hypothetical protein